MSTSDFSPGHRALPRIFANPKESQLAEITQLLFQSGSKHVRIGALIWSIIGALDVSTQTSHARLTSSFFFKSAMKIVMLTISALLLPASAKRASGMLKASIICVCVDGCLSAGAIFVKINPLLITILLLVAMGPCIRVIMPNPQVQSADRTDRNITIRLHRIENQIITQWRDDDEQRSVRGDRPKGRLVAKDSACPQLLRGIGVDYVFGINYRVECLLFQRFGSKTTVCT
jgi:hypothetical protein